MCSQAGVLLFLSSSQWSFTVAMIQTTVFLNRDVAKKKQASKGKKGGWKENMEIRLSQGRWEDDGVGGV